MRKFECPHCGHVKIFYGREARRSKKAVSGFTCPSCGRKVTADDVRRKRGKGPKPPGKGRKRGKGVEAPVRDARPKAKPVAAPPPPGTGAIEWRTRAPPYISPSSATHPSARIAGRHNVGSRLEAPRHSPELSLKEALFVQSGGDVPQLDELAPEPENVGGGGMEREAEIKELKRIVRTLDEHDAELASLERRYDEVADSLKGLTEVLERNVHALSALVSRLDGVLAAIERRA